MTYREIPSTAVEVQPGLWADTVTSSFGNMTMTTYKLYSAEGYCFYIPENNLDEEGNLLPENERTYYTYGSTLYRTIEQVNASVISVPYVPGYEIASGSVDHETI